MKLMYVRVSTEEQNEMRQIQTAIDLGIEKDNIFIDKQSGKTSAGVHIMCSWFQE